MLLNTNTVKKTNSSGKLFSVGYESLTLNQFIVKLTDNKIPLLVDVRLTPLSRKKGFSKNLLSKELANFDINYLHMPKLGNPKENRAIFQTKSIGEGRKRYLKHLNNGSRSAFEKLVSCTCTLKPYIFTMLLYFLSCLQIVAQI
jgi:uncharacterized protein (DUF488 family)